MKDILKQSINRCATAYVKTRTGKMAPDCYEKNGKLKKGYEGTVMEFGDFVDAYQRYDYSTENCVMWIKGDTVGLTIRGTDDAMTWLMNALAGKTEDMDTDEPYGQLTETGVRVHFGFHYGWLQIMHDWYDFMVKSGRNKVVIEGHSRGAAIAQAAGVATQYNYADKDITVYLWAPPRYFNKAGAVSYDKRVPKTLRIVNANDPVVHTPPRYMGYHDVGKLLQLGTGVMQSIAPTNWFAPTLETIPLFPVQVVGTLFRAFSAVDHYPMNYLKKLDDPRLKL